MKRDQSRSLWKWGRHKAVITPLCSFVLGLLWAAYLNGALSVFLRGPEMHNLRFNFILGCLVSGSPAAMPKQSEFPLLLASNQHRLPANGLINFHSVSAFPGDVISRKSPLHSCSNPFQPLPFYKNSPLPLRPSPPCKTGIFLVPLQTF